MPDLEFETAEISLLGDRQNNQDRSIILIGDSGSLLVVADGMGGHSDGAVAAETAVRSLIDSFRHCPHPVDDAEGFLEGVVNRAHSKVVEVGADLEFEHRPRTTVCVALIEEDRAHFAHVGDSRIYHLRDGDVLWRTRDHSHVEMLYQQGKISKEEMLTHPMRHFVEACLGGEPESPMMSISIDHELEIGDVLLLCSDGLWTPLDEPAMAQFLIEAEDPQDALEELAQAAVKACNPTADNTTATLLRVVED